MTLAYRIHLKQYETDEQFEILRSFLNEHRAAVDELALFSDYWHHGYTDPRLFAERMRIAARRIEQLHADGFGSVGINVITTMGHFSEAWDYLPKLPFQAMVGHDGAVSSCSPCPNTPEYRRYIAQRYRTAAEAKPVFIWVDDDVRMESHGEVMFGCFCPVCLARYGEAFDHEEIEREELVARLNAPDGRTWREEWVEFNVRTIEDLLADIARAVRQVNPDIELGLMTIGPTINTYSGQDITRWMNALGGNRIRPGHGYYEDSSPRGVIAKTLEVGRQNLETPPFVDEIQYELENFPYNRLDKSVQSALNECALALVAGCNGIAFNALKPLPGAFDDFYELLRGIAGEREVWQALVDAAQGLPLVGAWPAADPRLMAKREVLDGNWFSLGGLYNIEQPNSLAELGLPLTTDPKSAVVTLLSGRIAEALDDKALRSALSGGVLLDPSTLQVLWERGLGELAGVKVDRCFDNGLYERFTGHALNGAYAGESRDARMSMGNSEAWSLKPAGKGVAELTRYVAYDDSDQGIAMTAYENAIGGRVVAMGYFPWARLGSGHKRAQILAAVDWAAKGRVPLLIERLVRVTPFVRQSADGCRIAAVLLNTGFDPTDALEVRLRATPERVEWVQREGSVPLSIRRDGHDTLITVPDIAPWNYGVLIGR